MRQEEERLDPVERDAWQGLGPTQFIEPKQDPYCWEQR